LSAFRAPMASTTRQSFSRSVSITIVPASRC
jgi:hypothetical protein